MNYKIFYLIIILNSIYAFCMLTCVRLLETFNSLNVAICDELLVTYIEVLNTAYKIILHFL